MQTSIRAFEVGGTIDEHQQLHLDSPLPVTGPSRVRVIVLVPDDDEPNEREWLHGAMTNPAFDFLNDPEEDIYSLADGKPFRDQA